jgi:hypothetical protein
MTTTVVSAESERGSVAALAIKPGCSEKLSKSAVKKWSFRAFPDSGFSWPA